MPAITHHGVGGLLREMVAHIGDGHARGRPWGGKQGDVKVAWRGQTCKLAAVWLHRQPPHCRDGNLLAAMTPAALSGQGLGGSQEEQEGAKPSRRSTGCAAGAGATPGWPRCPEGWEWHVLAPGRPAQATALRTQICLCLQPKKTKPPLF